MRATKPVLAICCCSAAVACARQDEHLIRVVHHDAQDFVASDCDALTGVVHAVARRYRLQETQGVSHRDTFPRYRSYWSRTNPVSLDLHCDSNMLQATVTAVRSDRGEGDAYEHSIGELSAEIKSLFGSGIEESEDWIVVNRLRW